MNTTATAHSKHYECFVTETTHSRDIDNYDQTSGSSWLATAPDLDALYEQLAEVKTRETTAKYHGDPYVTVSFGVVREICLASVNPVDIARLKQTAAWSAHARSVQEELDRQAQAANEAAAQTEARERAELARLYAQYGAPVGDPAAASE